jgi:membrane-associated phospholipid phosphatase
VERRSHYSPIGSFYFAWERYIPFVPLMVIPYWSIDPLYFFGTLVCTNRRQLHEHVKRIVAAFVVSCAIFLALPLKEAFDRPPVSGISGFFFRLLSHVDRPFNMAPSLHITEIVLLWVIYIPRLSGWAKRIVQAWFVLIYISTLFTFQHHVIDLITGQILAMICLYVFPYRSAEQTR